MCCGKRLRSATRFWFGSLRAFVSDAASAPSALRRGAKNALAGTCRWLYWLRTELKGVAGKVLSACGIRIPAMVRPGG